MRSLSALEVLPQRLRPATTEVTRHLIPLLLLAVVVDEAVTEPTRPVLLVVQAAATTTSRRLPEVQERQHRDSTVQGVRATRLLSVLVAVVAQDRTEQAATRPGSAVTASSRR
jgi:hypothetical protein